MPLCGANGTLTAFKIGGFMFYSYNDISKLQQGNEKEIIKTHYSHFATHLCTTAIVADTTPKSNAKTASKKSKRKK